MANVGMPHSPSTPTSSTSSVFFDPEDTVASALFSSVGEDDPMAQELAALEELRRNMQKNLKLRPIATSNGQATLTQNSPASVAVARTPAPFSLQSPVSAISTSSRISFAESEYYDAISEPPTSARPMSATSLAYYFDDDASDRPQTPDSAVYQDPTLPRPLPPAFLLRTFLDSSPKPLIIDTRPAGSYLASRLPYSLNVAIPSLILKRCRKPGGGFSSLSAIRAFITTERGKATWDRLLDQPGTWDGTVVVYDEDMDERDPLAPNTVTSTTGASSTAWILLLVLKTLIPGPKYWLRGGISAVRRLPDGEDVITSGEREVEMEDGQEQSSIELERQSDIISKVAPTPPSRKSMPKAQLQIRTDVSTNRRPLPELQLDSAASSTSGISLPSPRRMNRFDSLPSTSSEDDTSDSMTPSPPRSAIPPPSMRRPMLAKLDVSKAEKLKPAPPKLQLMTNRNGSSPTPGPVSSVGKGPKLKLSLGGNALHKPTISIIRTPSSRSPSPTATRPPRPPATSGIGAFTVPRSPTTPTARTPLTAKPELDVTDASPAQEFIVSTILPGFLYLGPEIILPEQAAALELLGVKRILNIAVECDDDHGLRLKDRFEKYIRIPMRDTVEEVNVAKRMREVCDILDDARLHSSATYVHCKAGKSRSVTAVMAYLIHANHWALSKAYGFVLDRRKGISPNIGFVSELMNFEEAELGGRSGGVVPGGGGGGGGGGQQNGKTGGRRGGQLRESMPPVLSHASADGAGMLGGSGGWSAGAVNDGNVLIRDTGEEMEVRDASGRYRHVRRAPVDEYTLQPTRRVSKAGLESTWDAELDS